ncbi:MAG: lysophospholipase, partial [Alphaproteobacteria bacterium]
GLALAGCAPRLQVPGPHASAPAPPQMSDSAFVAADGTALPLRRWLPADNPHPKPPRAVVGALHGFNDYSNAFDGIAGFLADNGVAVYAYDQRGFGAAPQTGLWPGTGRLTGDARDFFATLRARHPGVPVFAMGESMGGAVLLAAETEAPLDVAGFVLVAPAVWGRATMPFYQTGALWLTAHTLPWLTVTGRGLNIRPSDNIEMLRALSRDPLVIRQTRVDAVWGLVNLMDTALDAAPRFAAPALFLYGARDELVPAEPTLRLYDGLPEDGAVTIAIYGEGYHMLLRDLQAETVWRDVLAWIGDPTAPLPSGAEAVDPKAALAKD